MNTLRAELLRVISNLPGLSDVPERKAFVGFTKYPDVGLYLDWSGSQVTFAEALIDELSRRGQRFTVSFLGAACQVPQVGPEAVTHLRALAAQIERLRPDEWLSEFPVEPLTAQDRSALQADLDMLADAVVSSTLLPYFALGADALAAKAGPHAVQIANVVAARVATAVTSNRLTKLIFEKFTQKPVEMEQDFLAGLRDLLDHDVDLARDLAAHLTAEPNTDKAALQPMAEIARSLRATQIQIATNHSQINRSPQSIVVH